ncbi:hypothetical protein AB0C59_32270 [Streptomyces sp. NPDC048664]|uniref:hypothetical protein n=1 Tax=Streptomyces sp. NPDC048664 TaxID=3154505 RepID=UPI00343EC169
MSVIPGLGDGLLFDAERGSLVGSSASRFSAVKPSIDFSPCPTSSSSALVRVVRLRHKG